MIDLVDRIAQDHLKKVKIKEDFVSAICPFHKAGGESHPSFWINREKGFWGCFTCGSKGPSIKKLLKELGVKNKDLDFELEEAEKEASKNSTVRRLRAKRGVTKFTGDHTLPESLLGVFHWLPTGLLEAGFTKEVLKEHDIGFDKRIERVTFPIRDIRGTLVGISGRATRIGDIPKYLFYNGRKMKNNREVLGELGEWYPSYSNANIHNHLWRMDKCYKRLIENKDGDEQLIIVEGFKAALWLVQNGWINTVALMGTSLSKAQETLIRALGVETFVFLDNNKPGRSASAKICQRLAVSTFPVYQVSYPSYSATDDQPDDLNEEELEIALTNSRRIGAKYV